MSEKEKDILRKISFTLPKLSKDKQSYILGVAEGMALMADIGKTAEIEKEEVCAGS